MSAADPADELRSLWRARSTWYLTLAFGACLAVVDASQIYVWSLAFGRRIPYARLLVHHLVFWLNLACLVPAVLFIAARVRLDTRLRLNRVLVHLVAATTIPAVHLATATMLDPQRVQRGETFESQFFRWVVDFWAMEFLGYWAIVTALYMLQYRRESRWRAAQTAQLEAHLTRVRLQVLRAQLNPHFIFNTLNSISVLALRGQQDAVVDMLARLSNLLRVALDDRAPHEIPLAKELEFLDAYLDIQRVRFADRMTVRRDIAPDVLECLVPTMILQPVVENAVVHGIGCRTEPGVITIRACRDDDLLHLAISDTGPGFGSDGPRTASGIGLPNTLARLEQLYGSHQRVECLDGREGATVSIRLPFRQAVLAAPPQLMTSSGAT